MDIIVPFAYKDVRLPWGSGHQFNLADIQIEPLLLSWHLKQFDIAAGLCRVGADGNFDTSSAITLPHQSRQRLLVAHAHARRRLAPRRAKTWSLSLLGRYEICHEQDDTHVTPGNMGTLEWASANPWRKAWTWV